jgi:predicted transcriptional regulator
VDWKTFAWIKRGNRRKEVLKLFAKSKNPLSSSDVKNNLNISLPQVSLIIKEMSGRNLLNCLNPEDKIGKIYVISQKGEIIQNELQNRFK